MDRGAQFRGMPRLRSHESSQATLDDRPLSRRRKHGSDLQRFLQRIHVCQQVLGMSACWLWTGYTNEKGYGVMQVTVRPHRYLHCRAHRLSFSHFIGPIPDGYVIDHLCGVRRCVNPDHLEATTDATNLKRAGHYNTRKTHCIRGHAFTEDNTVQLPNGHRKCRACRARTRR
jgi:hypothetical protein